MKTHVKDYPRPQFVRENWTNLNGNWDFCFDDENMGEAKNFPANFPKEQTINVPFTYETKLSGIADETVHNNVWYSKTVSLARTDLDAKKLMLHFEGSDYTTKVWVNGTFIGSHTGAYSRFSFDISTYALVGENTIVVKAEDSLDDEQPRGKQRWINNNFGCWYVQTTGIWKTVWLEYLPVSSVEKVKITPVLRDRAVEIEYDVLTQNYNPNLTLELKASFEGTFVNSITVPVLKKHGKIKLDMFSLDVFEWGIKTWSNKNPDLYDLDLTLCLDGKIIDTVSSYFGMREIKIEGNQILLNGVPLYQKLILDQGYWNDSHLTPPSEEALIEDIEKVKALGYNGVRKHQKVEDERFIYYCDTMGLLVWSEVGASYTFSDYAVTEFTNQWMEIVQQNYNHPSIITWTPFNESWGIPNIKTNRDEQQFTEAIYYLTKAYDQNRPVIVNDGWEHTISDIITLHDYEELGELFLARYTDIDKKLCEYNFYHSDCKSSFANGYTYKGQPIIISEFGGIAFNNDDAGWGYGNKVCTEDDFVKRFDSITTAIKEVPQICGYCYTQVTDVQQEINGLMDIDRNFKIAPELICSVNDKKVGTRFY